MKTGITQTAALASRNGRRRILTIFRPSHAQRRARRAASLINTPLKKLWASEVYA